ncbi:MAG TPA: right-handed parallel beta-helix repeat-containing protein [Spirochaetota bacterium]|nr:right-handed parallel beta-helix repeat-containing protein [Spirochaetota bacterium]HOM38394.1 right-handed parallel beta-helix repeat-containing protein [Spirochaetota bacterium]HPQ48388.1 right-handed parallel beta-helix repeat-containing protein [Spirochaetota bacterium]
MFKKIVLLFLIILTTAVFTKDIYVKAGSDGDGTKEKPFGYIWLALSKAERGDVIHVAQGTYNGKGGSGCFIIDKPGITLVGGYKDDFSERDPFKYFTILERAKDYKGDVTGLKDGIIDGSGDHSGFILDGFVLNSQTRNSYVKGNTKIEPKNSWPGALIQLNSANIKILNSILLNPYGEGIYVTWKGKDNRVENNFIINTFYNGISTRSAQPGSEILIKNNTIIFGWFQPGKGGAIGIFVGREGKTIIESNIIGYMQTEGGEAGNAVTNTFGNEDTVLKNNIFFQCQGGYYKYMDAQKKNLLVWKKEELKMLESEPEEFMLSEASGNSDEDPGIKPDPWYFDLFTRFVASEPGKLEMDKMNQIRSMLGLPLQAKAGSSRENWGMPYPLEKIVPNLVSKTGKGVNISKSFEKYVSTSVAEENKEYEKVDFEVFEKSKSKTLVGKNVEFNAGIGDKKTDYLLKDVTRDNYDCYMILAPGETNYTRKYVFGYFLRGSKAHKALEKYMKKISDINKSGGFTIKGTAFYIGKDTYPYPVGIIIDDIKK